MLYPSMLTESWVEGKSVGEKDAQPTERTAALWGLSNKIDSRIWVNFTRNGPRLGSRHQEPPHTDVSRNLATVVVFLLLSHSWTTDNVRGILPWAKEMKNWTVAQWSKVLFSDERKFCISFGNQGPRVWRKGGEAHSPNCMKSSVKFPQSVMIWGAMSSAGVGPLCFWKPTSLHPFTKKFWSTSCFLLLTSFLKMLISFPAGFGTCPHCQKHQKLVKWPWCWCAWLASKLTRPEPHREYMGYCQEENEKQDTKKCRWAEGHCQRNLGFHTTSAVPQTDHLHATLNWGSN